MAKHGLRAVNMYPSSQTPEMTLTPAARRQALFARAAGKRRRPLRSHRQLGYCLMPAGSGSDACMDQAFLTFPGRLLPTVSTFTPSGKPWIGISL